MNRTDKIGFSFFCVVFLQVLLILPAVLRADLYVARNGQTPDPLELYSSWATAASNIQEAVTAAAAGSTIRVAPGKYNAMSGDGNVVLINKSLSLIGDSEEPENVVIDGEGSRRGVYLPLPAEESLEILIDGFTITGGIGQGAGLNLDHSSALSGRFELRNSVIKDNHALGSNLNGGGIYVAGKEDDFSFSVLLHKCTISDNSAARNGGGCTVSKSLSLSITDSIIENNYADGIPNLGFGGGIYLHNDPATKNMSAKFENCIIKGNRAARGGGGVYGGNLLISIIVNNCTLDSNEAIGSGGGIHSAGCCYVTNSVVSKNLNTSLETTYAAGIFLGNASPEVIVCNSLLTGNSGYAGAICSANAATGFFSFVNCTIVSNSATGMRSGGLYIHGAAAKVDVCNSILYHNVLKGNVNNYGFTAGADVQFCYSCITPKLSSSLDGGNNTTANPLLADFANLDCRLTPKSPCRDAGTNQLWMINAKDLDERPRIDLHRGIVDMGCYEFVTPGSILLLR